MDDTFVVGVLRIEKDPGFFASLRMTQKKARRWHLAGSGRPHPTLADSRRPCMLRSKSEDEVGRGRGRPIRPGSLETAGERGRRAYNSGPEPEQSLGRRIAQSPNRTRMGGAGTSGGGRMQAAVVVGVDVSKRTLG